jgi:hypothetical protein
MNQETVRQFVESWSTCWTIVLGLGYLGGLLHWPAMHAMVSDRVARAMVLSSAAVVLLMCVSGFAAAALSISGWAIGLSLIRRLVLSPE